MTWIFDFLELNGLDLYFRGPKSNEANSRCGPNPTCVLDKMKGKSGTYCSSSKVSAASWISEKSLKRSTCEKSKDEALKCYVGSDHKCTKHYGPYMGVGCSITCLT